MQKVQYCTLAILIGALCAMGFWSGTVQDQIISYDDNLLGWYTRMAVDSEGKIHVVWNEKTVSYPSHYEIHYSSSADNGRTWSALSGDIVISYDDTYNPANSSAIAVDSDDSVYVVWAEDDPTVQEIHYSISSNGGATWSGQTADHVLSYPGGGDANNPAMAVDGDDVIHVVWNQDYSGNAEIYYSRSIDRGATWSSQVLESIVSYPDAQSASYPDIAVGPNDELYVIYKELDDAVALYSVVNISMSFDGGSTWTGTSADFPVCQPVRLIIDPHIEVDPDGNIHVTWRGSQDTASPYHYEMFYSRSLDGGASWSGWSADRIISYYQTGGASVSNNNMGMDHCGYLYAVWNETHSTGNSEIHISISTDGGTSWSGETVDEIISYPDGINGYRPYLVAGIDDTLHVCWNEGVINNYYQINYSRGDALCAGVLTAIDDLVITMDVPDAVLTWDVIPAATLYVIYRSDQPGFTPTQADSVGYSTTNTWTDVGIEASNDVMYYNVTARD